MLLLPKSPLPNNMYPPLDALLNDVTFKSSLQVKKQTQKLNGFLEVAELYENKEQKK